MKGKLSISAAGEQVKAAFAHETVQKNENFEPCQGSDISLVAVMS